MNRKRQIKILLGIVFLIAVGVFLFSKKPIDQEFVQWYGYGRVPSHKALKTQKVIFDFLDACRQQNIKKAGTYWYENYDKQKLSVIVATLNKLEHYVHENSYVMDGAMSYEPFYVGGKAPEPLPSLSLIADSNWPGWWGRFMYSENYHAIFENETIDVTFNLEVKDNKPYLREIDVSGSKTVIEKLEKIYLGK